MDFRLAIVIISIGCVHNSVIRQEGEQAKSLYTSDDKVFVLTHENFYQSVYDQAYASNVEFYNSFCGFCRNFAPIYKQFAEDVYGWRDIVRVSAIDCAADANNDICRDMEIMRYPTLRYFPPYYRNESGHFGVEVQHAAMTVGEPFLLELMANTSESLNSWPKLHPVNVSSASALFNESPSQIEYIFMIYDGKNDSSVTQKVALDLHKVKQAQIRHIASTSVAIKLGLKVQSAIFVGIKSAMTIQLVEHLKVLDRDIIRQMIRNYLTSKGIRVTTENVDVIASTKEIAPIDEKSLVILDYVKAHPDVVFQSDLESAIRFSIFHELVKYNVMNDEQRTAILRYLAVLNKYSPLGDNGQRFLAELNAHVQSQNRINGKELSDKIKELENKYKPIFSSTKWIGCSPSVTGRRGYSCGLWQLFHYLTVQATNSDKSHDPLEVLQAIHGFVKHFFGCTHCSNHFQEMAERNNIWKVNTKDDAVIWLWTAHNEVNRRLAGDSTEDPVFRKIQYPSRVVCEHCHQTIIPLEGSTPSAADDLHWHKGEVLYYLRRVYSFFNLSRYGVDDESVLPEMLTSAYSSKLKTSSSTGYSSALSEMDVRLGILLYAICMLIIVIAVKLFLQRGYRKKVYTHDFLGKM